MSIVILMNMKETHPEKQKFHYSLLKLAPHEIVEPRVLPAAIVTLLGYISYGVVLTLIPDWSHYLGINNKGLFFVVFTVSSLLMRFVAGRVSDRRGRVAVLKAALAILIVAILVIGWAGSAATLMAGAFLYGVATGLFSPAASAWTADLSVPEFRGRAMATMYISLEAGIGLGALLSGWLFADVISRVPIIFYSSAAFTAFALLYLLIRPQQKNTAPATEMAMKE